MQRGHHEADASTAALEPILAARTAAAPESDVAGPAPRRSPQEARRTGNGEHLFQIEARQDTTLPQFTSVPGDSTISLGQTLNGDDYKINAKKPFSNDVSYALLGSPPDGASIDSITGQFTWTPGFNQRNSTYEIRVQASAGSGQFVNDTTFAVIVQTKKTQAQFIHNAADPNAETLDLYFNDEIYAEDLNDLSFRSATPFIEVPANIGLEVGFAPGNSSGPVDIIATQTLTFDEDSTYTVVANGVLTPDNFAANPDNKPIGFKFFVEAGAQMSADGAQVAFRGVHGATDAPTVDLLADGSTLFEKLTYEDVTSSYNNVSAGQKGFAVTLPDSNLTLSSFRTDLSDLSGEAATLLTSGFLDPSTNQNGPALRLLAARPDGSVKQFARNRPPQFVPGSVPPDTTVAPETDVGGDAYNLDVGDPDDDPITFRLEKAPDGASLGTSDGQFSWTPTFSQRDSTYQVKVRATDGIDTTATSFSITVTAKTADVQFIHNAADPNLQRVDLYLDDTKIADNLSFRSATAFQKMPAGGAVELGVADQGSQGPGDAIATQTVTFTPNSTYTAAANGVLNPNNFAPNPDGEPTGFTFFIESGAMQNTDSDKIALRTLHGVTDLPTVDIDENGTTLFNGLTYGDVTSEYLSLPADKRRLVVSRAQDGSKVKAFQADTLASFAGQAASVLASGFLDSSAVNQGGPSLQLIAALPNGEVVPLRKNRPPTFSSVPEAFTVKPKTAIDTAVTAKDPDGDSVSLSVTTPLPEGATFVDTSGQVQWTPTLSQRDSTYHLGIRASDGEATTDTSLTITVQTGQTSAQFIHNAADPSIDTVDVYLDDDRVLDDFGFRSATSLLETKVPTGVGMELGIAPQTSSDSGDVISNQPVMFDPDSSYTIVARGLRTPNDFVDNPSGKAVSFEFSVEAGTQTEADGDQVNLRGIHSVTDAPTLDVIAVGSNLSGGSPLFKGVTYGNVTSDYEKVTSEEKRLVLNQADTSNAIAAFRSDLTPLSGQAAMVMISGFLEPSLNQNGTPLELLLVQRDGEVTTFTRNKPPQFQPDSVPGDTTVMPGTALGGDAYNFSAMDPEGDPFFFALDQAPDGAAIDSTTGQFTWTPTLTQRDSTYQIRAQVSDGPSATDTTFAVTVQTKKASVQFVHNVADPNVKNVDLYLDGEQVIDDIGFRNATSFRELPADLGVTMTLTPGSADGIGDSLVTRSITFDSDSTYSVIAGGVSSPQNFADNPDGKDIGLSFFVETGAKQSAGGDQVALRMVHGVTDAPALNVISDESILFGKLRYGTVTPNYRSVPAEETDFIVTPGPPTRALEFFQADTLSSLPGRAATLVASGFVDSSAVNQGGPALRLLATLPNGEVLSLDRKEPPSDSITIDIDRSFNGGRQQSDYRLVGLPGRTNLPLGKTLPGNTPNDWRAFVDNGDSLVEHNGSDRFNFRPGRGFWLITENSWSVSQTVEPVRLSDSSTASIPLHDGWNIISNPLAKDVPWAAVQTVNDALTEALYRWTGSTYSIDSTFASAQSGVAYYVLNNAGLDSLKVPALNLSSKTEGSAFARDAPQRLGLEVVADNTVVASAWLGIQPGAASGLDRFDQVSPPQYFGPTSLQSENEEIESSFPLTADIRPADAPGHTYRLLLKTEPGTSLTLRANGGAQWTEDHQLRLYDETRGRMIDLREQPTLDLTPREERSEYTLVAGRPSYVENQMSALTPSEFRVQPNYPNPFRDRTTLTYVLPEQMKVTVEIYDVLGRKVHTLVREKKEAAGAHTLTWEGTTDSGAAVASGTYFARIRAGTHSETIKMVIVR